MAGVSNSVCAPSSPVPTSSWAGERPKPPDRLAVVAIILAAVAVDCACPAASGVPDAGAVEDQAGSVDDLVAAWLEYIQICELGANGFGAVVEPDGAPPSFLRVTTLVLEAGLALALQSGRVIVHEEAIPACIAASLAPTDCSAALPEDCDAVFEGTVPVGGACALRFECTSQECDGATTEQCGVCGTGEVAISVAGDPCASPFACGPGLYCDLDGGVCAEQRNPGDTCSIATLHECIDTARCEGNPSSCVALLPIGTAVGDPCDATALACGASIVSGLACQGEPGAQQCVAAVVVDDGGVCDTHGETDANAALWCRNGLSASFCEIAFDADEGVCRRRPGLGDACDVNKPCNARAATCSETFSGTCVEFIGAGASCDDFEACEPGLYCRGSPPICEEDPGVTLAVCAP